MSLAQLGIAGLLAYLALLALVTELARRARRDASPSDHFLAGRELGATVLFFTLYATAYSGNSLLGYPGEAYRRGFSWVLAIGFMLSIVVAFHLLVPKLRPLALRQGFVTPGDWMRHRFAGEPAGRALQLAVAILMSAALANFLFAQLKAMGLLAAQVTGGLVSYELGVVVLAGAILLYETLGGMRAVAWTDAVQGALMFAGLFTLLVWLLGEVGGVAALTRAVGAARPAAIAVPDARECTNWVSTIVLLALASILYPQAIQRIYAARSSRALRRSLAWMSFMPLCTTLVVTLIGLAAIPRFAGLGEIEADRVMPLLLGAWAEAGLAQSIAAVVVFLGALAAIMSTADSVLLSLGSIAAEDVVGARRDAAATTQLGKRIAVVVMVAMAGLALVARQITLWGLIELKMELLIQCLPAFLVALHWSGLRAMPSLVGLLVGCALAVSATLLDAARIAGMHAGLLALGANLGIAVIGSQRWARLRWA